MGGENKGFHSLQLFILPTAYHILPTSDHLRFIISAQTCFKRYTWAFSCLISLTTDLEHLVCFGPILGSKVIKFANITQFWKFIKIVS